VLAISRELLSRGHEVHVACGRPDGLLGRAAMAGAKPHLLNHLQRAVMPFREVAAWSEISSLICQLRPDLVHTHSSKAGVIGRLSAAAARRRLGTRIVIAHTCHGLSWGTGRRAGHVMALAYRLAERLTGGLCDRVIAVSEGVMEEITRQRLYPAALAATIYNGVDLGPPGPGPFRSSSQRRQALGLSPDPPQIVMVARLADGKGHLLAIEAAVVLARRGTRASLALVGAGPLRDTVEAAAARARREGAAVVLLGHRDDVPDILRAADVFLLPSSAEGLGLAAVEAMAACLPVVGFEVCGMTEAVANGRTGRLVCPGAAATGLADALEGLIRDHDHARALGAAGRARAEALFSLDNTSQAVDFLCDVARCPGTGHSWEVAGG